MTVGKAAYYYFIVLGGNVVHSYRGKLTIARLAFNPGWWWREGYICRTYCARVEFSWNRRTFNMVWFVYSLCVICEWGACEICSSLLNTDPDLGWAVSLRILGYQYTVKLTIPCGIWDLYRSVIASVGLTIYSTHVITYQNNSLKLGPPVMAVTAVRY